MGITSMSTKLHKNHIITVYFSRSIGARTRNHRAKLGRRERGFRRSLSRKVGTSFLPSYPFSFQMHGRGSNRDVPAHKTRATQPRNGLDQCRRPAGDDAQGRHLTGRPGTRSTRSDRFSEQPTSGSKLFFNCSNLQHHFCQCVL